MRIRVEMAPPDPGSAATHCTSDRAAVPVPVAGGGVFGLGAAFVRGAARCWPCSGSPRHWRRSASLGEHDEARPSGLHSGGQLANLLHGAGCCTRGVCWSCSESIASPMSRWLHSKGSTVLNYRFPSGDVMVELIPEHPSSTSTPYPEQLDVHAGRRAREDSDLVEAIDDWRRPGGGGGFDSFLSFADFVFLTLRGAFSGD